LKPALLRTKIVLLFSFLVWFIEWIDNKYYQYLWKSKWVSCNDFMQSFPQSFANHKKCFI